MDTLANSEDPDEIMLHNAAFHLGLHSLLEQKLSLEKEIQFLLEIISCDTSIILYTMDQPKIIISYQVEEAIRYKELFMS